MQGRWPCIAHMWVGSAAGVVQGIRPAGIAIMGASLFNTKGSLKLLFLMLAMIMNYYVLQYWLRFFLQIWSLLHWSKVLFI